MASQSRRQAINLIDDIVEDGESYDFYQAIRLINRLSAATSGNGIKPVLRIRPDLNLDYPHSDISEIKRLENGNGFEIIATFFGLYGVSSPLPGFYTEELLDEEWDDRFASRKFLDIIHHHLYPLLYQAWIKYKFGHNAIESDNKRYWEIIYSLIGLSEEFRGDTQLASHLIKYSGIICQHPKTQLGLKTILADYFATTEVDVIPCVLRKVKVIERQRCSLGQQNNTLGNNSIVGQEVDDRSGKYVVRIGPVNRETFVDITENSTTLNFIRAVTKIFLVQPLEYEVQLVLEAGAQKSTALGQLNLATLGINTWLSNSADINNYTLSLA